MGQSSGFSFAANRDKTVFRIVIGRVVTLRVRLVDHLVQENEFD